MSGYQEKVDVGLPDSFLEPIFLDGFLHRLHDGVVVVHCKVEDETKRHDPKALLFRGELLVSGSQRHNILGRRMEDIDIRRQIVAPEVAHGVEELGFGGILLVQLMVSHGHHVDGLLAQNLRHVNPLWL